MSFTIVSVPAKDSIIFSIPFSAFPASSIPSFERSTVFCARADAFSALFATEPTVRERSSIAVRVCWIPSPLFSARELTCDEFSVRSSTLFATSSTLDAVSSIPAVIPSTSFFTFPTARLVSLPRWFKAFLKSMKSPATASEGFTRSTKFPFA